MIQNDEISNGVLLKLHFLQHKLFQQIIIIINEIGCFAIFFLHDFHQCFVISLLWYKSPNCHHYNTNIQ